MRLQDEAHFPNYIIDRALLRLIPFLHDENIIKIPLLFKEMLEIGVSNNKALFAE
jgi:hypothetical protein